MMEKGGNYLVAIVSIVAVVGLVLMFNGGSDFDLGLSDSEYSEDSDSAIAGQAWRLSPKTKIKTSARVDSDSDGDGYTILQGDCDDSDASLNPGTEWFEDRDEDGYGLYATITTACEQPTGYVLVRGDCNDMDSSLSPDATEICDWIDNDCDGLMDDEDPSRSITFSDVSSYGQYYGDADGDGYGNTGIRDQFCSHPGEGWVENEEDCDDRDASILDSC